MKIVTGIFSYFPHGGLQKDFLNIAQGLAERGHEVLCCTGAWKGKLPDFMQIVPFHLRGISNHARALDFERQFHAFCRAAKPDLTFAFNRFGGADFYFAADDCFRKIFLQEHSPLLRFLPRYKIFLKQEADIFKSGSLTRIFCLTERQMRDFHEIYGTPMERMTLLPPGIDPDRRRPPEPEASARRKAKRAELGIPDAEILLVQVAASFGTKGSDRILTSLASLPHEVRTGLRFCLVGGKPDMIAEAQGAAKKLGIAENVIFAGPRDDILDFLLAADLMVHPARRESAGITLTEAVAAGLPVFCSGECGYDYIVRAAGGEVLPAPFVQTRWNTVLLQILSDPEKLSRMRRDVDAYALTHDFTHRAAAVADVILSTETKE